MSFNFLIRAGARLTMLLSKNRLAAKRAYVTAMMQVIGRALEAASQEDEVIRKEIAAFPENFLFEMKILPNGPTLALSKNARGEFDFLGYQPNRKPDLSLQFKHLTHAFMVLTFQEGTARSFTNDRILVDGDVAYAVRLVRCLDRLETLILPKLLAQRALKKYPELPLLEKVTGGARIYGRLALNFVR